MIDIKNIFPECDADTLLVELITQRGRANHSKGLSKVEKAIKRQHTKDAGSILIALIDSDEFKNIHESKYIFSFNEVIVDKRNDDESLVLKRLPNTNNYAAFVCPEFEKWIWKQAQLAFVDPSAFDFPSIDHFYKISKHYGTNESKNLKKFVNSVVQANPPGIVLLRKWLVEQDFS